jgi:hypothetical protein
MERRKTGGTKGTNGVRVKGAARQHEGLRPEQRHSASTLSEIADLGGGSARLREEAPGAPEDGVQHALPWLVILALCCGAAAVIALVLVLVIA